MSKIIGKCGWCETRIEFFPSQDRTTCSLRCRSLLRASKDGGPRKPRKGINVSCASCGTLIYRPPRFVGKICYCSRKCKSVVDAKNQVVKSCEYCGKEIRLSPSQAAIRFCSNRCMGNGVTRRPLDWEHNGRPAKKD